MRTLIPTLTLATTLALASFSTAGPRQHKTAPPPSSLSVLEHLCQTLSTVAYRLSRYIGEISYARSVSPL